VTDLLGAFRDFLKAYKEEAFKNKNDVGYLMSTIFLESLVWI
jgi:hypothetical protein